MDPLRLTFVGHATVLLEIGGQRLLTDPLLGRRFGPLARVGAAVDPAVGERLDGILISHSHLDHLDTSSLRRLPGETPLVIPAGAARFVRRLGLRPLHELAVGEAVELGPLRVRAVPAVHDGHRWPHGPRAAAVGYVIEGDSRVYFAGDTALFAEMRELAAGLDLALVPIWGWGPRLGPGHLDPRKAAQALAMLRPRVAVPIHWGTIYPLGLRRIHPSPLTDPPLDFVREALRLAPDVDVRIVEPGGTLDVDAAPG
jgi:L-ascorbate metabolism protein UlaG (beta-lactamase superfamily)